MKKTSLFLTILILMTLAACPNRIVSPDSSLPPLLVKLPWEYKFGTPDFQLDHALSPDGKWLLVNTIMGLRVLSVDDPQVYYSDGDSERLYYSQFFWSPDSTAVAITASKSGGKCVEDRTLLIEMGDEKHLIRTVFTTAQIGCLRIFWDSESMSFLIWSNQANLTRVDRSAKAMKDHVLNNEEDLIFQGLRWTVNGIFVWANSIDAVDSYRVQIYDPISFQLVESRELPGKILAIAPDITVMLVRNPKSPEELYLVNTKNYETIKTFHIEGSIIYISEIPESPMSTMVIQDATVKYVYVLDWSSQNLQNCGTSLSIIGWRPNLKSPLVINKTYGLFGVAFNSVEYLGQCK